MTGRSAIVIGVAVAVLALLVSPVGATAGTLDQSQTNAEGGSGAVGASQQGAQTFTAGITGGLDQVDVHIRLLTSFPGVPVPVTCHGGSGVTAQIRTVTAGGTPSETIRASSSIAASAIPTDSVPDWVSIPFAGPAAVTAGTRYALVLVAPDATCTDGSSPYQWSFSLMDNPYAAGQVFFRLSGGSWQAQSNSDGTFKTYVGPAPPGGGGGGDGDGGGDGGGGDGGGGDGGGGDGGGGPAPDDTNDISFGKVKKNKRKGTAKLTVNVPGAGELELAKTKKVKPDEDLAEAAEKEKLSIKPRGKARKKLNSKGKAKVTAEVTYTPEGGTPNTEDKKIKLKKR
jgi:hypothetical protein